MKKKKYKEILSHYPEEYPDLVSHCKQVTKLAIQLFNKTCSLHKLGKKEKKYLIYASLLHDIGYIIDSISHNKHSCKFIIENSSLPFCKKAREVIACVARYHRGPLPKQTHKIFGKLDGKKQEIVTILSSLLRIADGLDYTHQNSIKSLKVKIDSDRVLIEVNPSKGSIPTIDLERSKKKSDLFAHVFQFKEVHIIGKAK